MDKEVLINWIKNVDESNSYMDLLLSVVQEIIIITIQETKKEYEKIKDSETWDGYIPANALIYALDHMKNYLEKTIKGAKKHERVQ